MKKKIVITATNICLTCQEELSSLSCKFGLSEQFDFIGICLKCSENIYLKEQKEFLNE